MFRFVMMMPLCGYSGEDLTVSVYSKVSGFETDSMRPGFRGITEEMEDGKGREERKRKKEKKKLLSWVQLDLDVDFGGGIW